MAPIDVLRVAWYGLIGLLFAGYSILDGFDLGIGVLFPFIARTEEEKRTLLRSIAPVWDGNEVWLLTGGGALFAAFPQVYATVFSGFYLALMLVLWALILRAVAPEFRAHDARRARFWEGAFVAGSVLPAVLFGVALGNVVAGVPLNGSGEYTGGFLTLLRPLPMVIGLLGLAAFVMQGGTYAALKTEGALHRRAVKAVRLARIAFVALFVLCGGMTLRAIPGAAARPLAWVAAAAVLVALALLGPALRRGRHHAAFWLSSTAFLGLWAIVGAIHFPNLVRATGAAELSLTIYNSSSGLLTLKVMTVIALLGMPIVVGYTVYVYRAFRGKVSAEEGPY
ncbi:MAG: cytochrome d ubiquinol oxidase subunit II [bacterium]|jgi:cytochrome d ubiquinol oxidase subunit II|nr:cytochrome d ubiquinol oxidase subunit II [candidate division KSB1 bacterium]MDH7559771.1 cytochrome d ubiquinol oxidase subunit II [bacterium]